MKVYSVVDTVRNEVLRDGFSSLQLYKYLDSLSWCTRPEVTVTQWGEDKNVVDIQMKGDAAYKNLFWQFMKAQLVSKE